MMMASNGQCLPNFVGNKLITCNTLRLSDKIKRPDKEFIFTGEINCDAISAMFLQVRLPVASD